MSNYLINLIPALDGEELVFLQALLRGLPESKVQNFIAVYNGKRRKADQILLGCAIGFFGFAGVQRFMVGQIGMGIVYFFTGGFCLIGTIIDLVNHKKLTFEYNRQMARESLAMISSF